MAATEITERLTGPKIQAVFSPNTPIAQQAVGSEVVTFYHWIGKYPSCEIIRVKGGQRRISADGQVMHDELLEARFHNGLLTTSDPEIIALLRGKFGAPGSGITENAEEYYAHVMTPQQVAKRQIVLAAQAKDENAKLREENSRLVAQLQAAGAKKKTE